MESPVKMKMFSTEANKENIEARYESDEIAVPIKGIPVLDEPEKTAAPAAADSIKEDEDVEPILQENAQRFVLFPIKYHEVCILLRWTRRRVKWIPLTSQTDLANVQESRSILLDRRGD